jgi:aspartate kinase
MLNSPVSFSADAPLHAFKFGGTSVGSVERFRRVIRVVEAARTARVLVVNSALSNVTRQLDGAMDAVAASPPSAASVADELLAQLRTRHREQAADVLAPASQMQYASIVERRLARLREALEQAARAEATPALRDQVLAIGEQLAVPMVALALHDAGLDAALGDATQLLRTDATFGAAVVDGEATRAALCTWYASLAPTVVPVLAGFIGGTDTGAITTLGFEGSDYSAALFSSMLNADVLTRYTDVDGLYTEDPRTHDDATPIDLMTMEAALARTEGGELGIHPKTLRPLVEAGIPLRIRSIDALEAPGTRIVPEALMKPTGSTS